MRAGLGTYDGPATHFVNQSRLSTWKQCSMEHYLRYHRDYTAEAEHPALTQGTAWHECLEAFDRRGINQARLAAAPYADEPWYDWLLQALDEYATRYGDSSPLGEAIAVEAEFWLELELFLHNGQPVTACVLGTFDRLGRTFGELIVGERKTVAAGTDFGRWFEMREHHPQHTLYTMAAAVIARDPEFRRKHKLNGKLVRLVYDCVRKDPYPQRPSKSGTLEERRERWATGLLHTRDYPWGFSAASRTQVERELADYFSNQHARSRNQWACLWQGGSVRCDLYGLCYHGSTAGLTERRRDYVDAARERTGCQQ